MPLLIPNRHDKVNEDFKLSQVQAQAILDMPLKRLAALERKKIEQEYKEISDLVKELQLLLRSPKKMRQQVGSELAAVREKYQDRRRTQIVALKEGKEAHELLTVQDVTPAEIAWVGLTQDGKLFRTTNDQAPKMSGRDAPAMAARVDSHQNLYIVSQTGKCVSLAIHTIPVTESLESGIDVRRITAFSEEDRPIQMFAAPNDRSKSSQSVVTISREGLIKKSELSELPGASSQTFVLSRVNDSDEICQCLVVGEEPEYLAVTEGGMAIRFAAEEVRSMGLIAAGVNAIKLAAGDKVVGLIALKGKGEISFITSDGSGWRIPEEEFPLQKRYGQGVIVGKLKPESRILFDIFKKNTQYTLFLQKSVPKSLRLDAIPIGKRSSVVKVILELKPTDSITSVVQPYEFVEAPSTKEEKKKPSKAYKQEPIL